MRQFIDLHCDTLDKLITNGGSLRRNNFHVDLDRLRGAGCAAQLFAIFINTSLYADPYARCLDMVSLFHSELTNNADNTVNCVLTVEDSGIFGGDIAKLRELHALGVRLVTLTWNHKNAVGSPNTTLEHSREGLTPRGFELLVEMERLGILADVSHLSDAGFWDVARRAARPFVASHSNARAVTSYHRNLTDDQLRALANAGGVAGLNFCAAFVRPRGGDPYAPFAAESGHCTTDDLALHAAHMIRVAGEDTPALGSDFDGIDDIPEGLDGVEKLPLVADALTRAGLTERQLDKIFYSNAARVLADVL